jgi:hypothetical protein
MYIIFSFWCRDYENYFHLASFSSPKLTHLNKNKSRNLHQPKNKKNKKTGKKLQMS